VVLVVRMTDFENGEKVASYHRSNSVYHTQKECSNYPQNPKSVTPSKEKYHEMRECMFCEKIRKGEIQKGDDDGSPKKEPHPNANNWEAAWESRRKSLLERHGIEVE